MYLAHARAFDAFDIIRIQKTNVKYKLQLIISMRNMSPMTASKKKKKSNDKMEIDFYYSANKKIIKEMGKHSIELSVSQNARAHVSVLFVRLTCTIFVL